MNEQIVNDVVETTSDVVEEVAAVEHTRRGPSKGLLIAGGALLTYLGIKKVVPWCKKKIAAHKAKKAAAAETTEDVSEVTE